MKLGMKYEKMEMPCDMGEEKEHFPTLHIQLDEDKVKSIDKLSNKGTAKISYEIERVSKENNNGKVSGSLVLKVKSIEPMKEESKEESDSDSNEALDSFMDKMNKEKE